MKKDIRNLVMVISASLLLAVGITSWFLLSYGPSGQYYAKNTLANPSILARLDYNDMNPKTNQMDRYVFDKILYTFWNKTKQEQGSLVIPIPVYEKFYNLVQADDSILQPTSEMSSAFRSSPPARLAVKVHTESNVDYQKDAKDLTLVEVAGDYWRVELNDQNTAIQWVYYKHPNIAAQTQSLFIP